MNRELDAYFSLAEKRPELFAGSSTLPICMDRETLLEYQKETGCALGITADNSPYFYLLSDLIQPTGADPFVYMRVVPCSDCGGSVILPRWRDDAAGEDLFGVLRIFRHAIRREVLELPRGYMDPSAASPEENAIKELREELGVEPRYISGVKMLGTSYPDTGLTAGKVNHFLVSITGPHPNCSCGHEGIQEALWLTRDQLLERLRNGEIVDGMTQNALLQFFLRG